MREQKLIKKSGQSATTTANTPISNGAGEPEERATDTLPLSPASCEPPDRPLATPAHYVPVRNETLEKRLSRRLDLMDNAMTDAEFEARLERATLKDMAVVEGIYLDKLKDLRGTPNRVVGSDTRAKLAEVGAALMQEMTRRGLNVKLTERVAEITTDSEPKVIDAK